MTHKPQRWKNRTPTKTQIRMAYAAQAPIDRDLKPLEKQRSKKRGDDKLPDWDGIGGTDREK